MGKNKTLLVWEGEGKGKGTFHNLVESMLTSASARQILYEKLVPRYKDRHFFFTRVVNKWEVRQRDSARLGLIEYVDYPGELYPANPVGEARKHLVAREFEASRRNRRRYASEAIKLGLVSAENPSALLPEASEIYLAE